MSDIKQVVKWRGEREQLVLGFRFDPVKFVLEKGDEWDRFRLLIVAGLTDHSLVKGYVRKLIGAQNSDGGFPREEGKPSSVLRTVEVLGWLVQLDMDAESRPVRKAIDFLWASQRVDGSWCENPEVTLEEWMTWISNKHGMSILTSQIIQLLCDLGYKKDPRIAKAIQYIKDTQRPNGHWPAHDDQKHPDPDASCVLALLKVGEADSAQVEKAVDAMLGVLREESVENADEAYHLWKVWPTLVEAGYKFDRNILESRVDRLREIQREDGGWRFYWSQESVPRYVVSVLTDLVNAGIISRIELRKAIEDII